MLENYESFCSQRQEGEASARAAAFAYDYAYYFRLAKVQMQADAFRGTCAPACSAVQQKSRLREETVLFFHLRVIAEGYARWTAI